MGSYCRVELSLGWLSRSEVSEGTKMDDKQLYTGKLKDQMAQ
jgi:hypothetical protein